MATLKKSFVNAALATAALGAFASASQAGLMMVYDLRMADGTKTATLTAAGTPAVKLYATLWGTDADLSNDNWTSGYFGVSSSQGSMALITAGNVTLSTTGFNGPFNHVSAVSGKAYSYNGSRYVAGSAQTTYAPPSDGFTDWGGSVSTTVSNWALWSAASEQHSSGLSGGTSVNDGQGHSGYEYLMATFTINATAVNNVAGAKTFFNVDTPVAIGANKQWVKNGAASSFLTIAGEGSNNISGLQISIGAPIEFDAAIQWTEGSYTLAAGSSTGRMMKGQTTNVSVGITNLGGTNVDSLSYTGLSLTPSAGVTLPGTNAVVAPTATFTKNGTFTTATPGVYNLTASVASVTSANGGTGTWTLIGTPGSTAITVVDDRQVTASSVHFGRVLAGAVAGSSTLTTDTTSDFLTNITVNLSSAVDASHGSIAATSLGVQSFTKTTGNGTMVNVGGTLSTFAGFGYVSGSVYLNDNGEAGLAGQNLTNVSIAYDAIVLAKRSAVATATANFGRVLGNAAVSGAATIHAPGATDQYTNVTVNGVVFFDAAHGVNDKTTNVNATTGQGTVNALTLATSEELVGGGTLNVDTSATIVGTAVKGIGSTYGDAITGNPIGGHLANMYATDNSGITVKFLAGVTSPDNEVIMRFRNPDSGNEPALARGGMLSSDVVDLSFGTTAPAYVLSMTYNDPGQPFSPYADLSDLIANGQIFLISKSGAYWQNAVGDNTGNVAGSGFENMSWDAFSGLAANAGKSLTDLMGYYGIDTSTHTVWAVLDHATEFSVVPEPAAVGLLALGALGLLGRRRR